MGILSKKKLLNIIYNSKLMGYSIGQGYRDKNQNNRSFVNRSKSYNN